MPPDPPADFTIVRRFLPQLDEFADRLRIVSKALEQLDQLKARPNTVLRRILGPLAVHGGDSSPPLHPDDPRKR